MFYYQVKLQNGDLIDLSEKAFNTPKSVYDDAYKRIKSENFKSKVEAIIVYVKDMFSNELDVLFVTKYKDVA